MIPIHPDDILVFQEVTEAMKIIARKYELPLRSISGFPMPRWGMSDRMGDCNGNGDIRLVLRCTVDGEWCEEPISPEEIWKTAAHELAHLRILNHGPEFMDFYEELYLALRNLKNDHKQKILDKLVKLQNSRQSEAELGNEAAAEAFAAMINKMLLEYELSPSDIDYARANDNDPIIELRTNMIGYGIKSAKTRVAWQEALAVSVADAHLCRILIRNSSNQIWFVGTKSHATVAEYVFGTMVPLIEKLSKKAELDYWKQTGCGRGINNMARGFRASWIEAFIRRIWERFREARQQAVAEAAAAHGTSQETSLIRLDGALIKVKKYIEDKFSASHKSAARVLAMRHTAHQAGAQAGRAAADAIPLGRRGLTGGTSRKLIEG